MTEPDTISDNTITASNDQVKLAVAGDEEEKGVENRNQKRPLEDDNHDATIEKTRKEDSIADGSKKPKLIGRDKNGADDDDAPDENTEESNGQQDGSQNSDNKSNENDKDHDQEMMTPPLPPPDVNDESKTEEVKNDEKEKDVVDSTAEEQNNNLNGGDEDLALDEGEAAAVVEKDMATTTDIVAPQDDAAAAPAAGGTEEKNEEEQVVVTNEEDTEMVSANDDKKNDGVNGQTGDVADNEESAFTEKKSDQVITVEVEKSTDAPPPTTAAAAGSGGDGDGDGRVDNDKDKDQNSQTEKSPTPQRPTKNDDPNPPQTKKKKNKVKTKHMDQNVLAIRRRIQIGCRDNDLHVAIQAYEDAIQNNIRIEPNTFYSLLNLCDGLERLVHSGTTSAFYLKNKNIGGDGEGEKDDKNNNKERVRKEIEVPNSSLGSSSLCSDASASKEQTMTKEVDLVTRQKYAFQIMDHMSKLNFPLNETCYTAIVRILSRGKDLAKAEEILNEAEQVQQCKPKLRLYSSLLISYCDAQNMDSALGMWKRVATHGLQVSEKELLALMKCASATGHANVMEVVLTDLAEEIAIPSKDTVATILEWFASYHSTNAKEEPAAAAAVSSDDVLREIHSHAATPTAVMSMGPVVNANGWDISSAVKIDTQTGILQSGCLEKCQMKPVPLPDTAWKEMSEMNEILVLKGQISGHKSEFQGGGKGKKRFDFSPQERKEQWDRYKKYLDEFADTVATKGNLDVIIDGANVGYFKQNFGCAPKHVDYYQIDWAVQHLQEQGKRILLYMHERHFGRDLMPNKCRHLQTKWEKDGILVKTPKGFNDDWFWLHAALRFKACVVTNDQMKDHFFQMLAPRMCLRWRERHQITFDVGQWENNNRKEVLLTYPPVYSRRIQRFPNGIVVPLAKRGDENRFLDGCVIASDDEPAEETYLCIRQVGSG